MKTHIYIAACDKGEKGGIYHYTQNADGSLCFCSFTYADRPMYLTISGERMYVLLRAPFKSSDKSGLLYYNIASDGSLYSPSVIESTEGVVACHMCIADHGENRYCVNYVSGSLIKMPDTLIKHTGDGPNKPRQDAPHTHFITESPDKKYIFNVDLGLDTIFVYDKDLNPVSSARVPRGHGCRHLAFSDDGKTVFCANELASTVTAFDYENGILSPVDTVSGLPDVFCGKSTMAAIRVENGYIYVSNRGDDSISCFGYKNKKLKLISVTSVGGIGPRDFMFINGFIYSTNESTNNTTVLKYISDGKFEKLPFEYYAPDPLCVTGLLI